MGIKVIVDNRKAWHNYLITDKMECGIVLMGSEVKSLRDGHCQVKDAYAIFKNGEMFLQNLHIREYMPSSYNNHIPERLRKLLLHKEELARLERAITEKGLSLVPLKLYFKNGIVKIELGLGKGKKNFDKRESIKKRDVSRSLNQQIRRSR